MDPTIYYLKKGKAKNIGKQHELHTESTKTLAKYTE